ncbi:WbqC family protein [Shivajiella indica]|uniref:WbqC family protein n=1 Tax=Shivajiella indica TaxID=872115 RepID=A0ABW5BCR2_9BACT
MAIFTELFYLPSLEYFTAILGHEEVFLDSGERYQKQTYRNRTRIRMANKIETLSVPVLGGNKKVAYKDIKIDYSQKWKNVHLRGIISAYGKAPFFEYFFPYLDRVYGKNLTYLFDLNFELLTVCLRLLQLNVRLTISNDNGQIGPKEDIRGILDAKQSFSERSFYNPQPYIQLFGVDFAPDLSVVDLLFCEGNEAKNILQASQKK